MNQIWLEYTLQLPSYAWEGIHESCCQSLRFYRNFICQKWVFFFLNGKRYSNKTGIKRELTR